VLLPDIYGSRELGPQCGSGPQRARPARAGRYVAAARMAVQHLGWPRDRSSLIGWVRGRERAAVGVRPQS